MQMPQVIGNKRERKDAMEGLELSRELAKQVLSQLSYVAHSRNTLHSKAFPPIPESVPSFFGHGVNPNFETVFGGGASS
jgi:hypothetical protein